MSDDFYIERRLVCEDHIFTEVQLLTESKYIIILAEPGAGKTELLNSLARKLNTNTITASVFNYIDVVVNDGAIVLDAFDELAKIDDAGIHKLLGKVSSVSPNYVIISSRSSEWGNSSSSVFKQFIGQEPLIVKLSEFDEVEQRAIYSNHTGRDDFDDFNAEIGRFELSPILPNPQFLKLFADAYIESDGHFSDKSTIFQQALYHLAREVNNAVIVNSTLTVEDKVSLASEVFAKLLLSGSEGISVGETSQDRIYPSIYSLLKVDKNDQNALLATKLFKLGDNSDQHRPIHKIVAEYGAATYLVKRICTRSDSLSVEQCFSVIAPNGVVRDELRGLVAWMASSGNQDLERVIIELDPYAVIANGDPSQLSHSSKRFLLTRLVEVEVADPYFRRGDFWRSYSVAGFFTEEVVAEIKTIITTNNDGDLRNFILELLKGSPAVSQLLVELQQIVHCSSESFTTRLQAIVSLLDCNEYDTYPDVLQLIDEANNDSLRLATHVITKTSIDNFSLQELERYFRNCAQLYSNCSERSERTFESRYYIKSLISSLSLSVVTPLLERLSEDLACTCGKKAYECDCRIGISKIIGALLDRFFELAKPPLQPLQIWQWVENLNFSGYGRTNDIASVKALQENHELRQEIIAHVFGNLTNSDAIFQMRIDKFNGHYSHAGLCLRPNDIQFLVDFAYENNNVELWEHFIPAHYHQDNKKGNKNPIKQHMRSQANSKPAFMRKWALKVRKARMARKEEYVKWEQRHRRIMRRRQNQEDKTRIENIAYFNNNREMIEKGEDFGALRFFSYLVLNKPAEINEKVGDEKLVRMALRNCLDFIEPDVPSLEKLAELQCASQCMYVETILLAACIEIFRLNGHLENVKPAMLLALRTNLSVSYQEFEQAERDSLKAEVDRLVFPDIESAKKFLILYLEPQLANGNCKHPEIGLLKYDEVFASLRGELAIDWLSHFEKLDIYALDELFDIAAQYSERSKLDNVIRTRCHALLSQLPEMKSDEKHLNQCKFWFIRAFYFLTLEEAEPYLDWLKSDKQSIFLLESRSGSFNRGEHPYWPKPNSQMVEAIFIAFYDKWPKVHLPSHWGTGSPDNEVAYRFITDIIWCMNSDVPEEAITVINRLLHNKCYEDIHLPLKGIKAEQQRKLALRDFEPPSAQEIVELLDNNEVVTVEGLRALIIHTFERYQKEIQGGEFNAANRFYNKDTNGNYGRLDEVNSVEIVAERLHVMLQPLNIIIRSEHQTKNQNRIDITATKAFGGGQKLLVIEAKGQWHSELYSAASTQLYERYSIHPDAEQQGIYLVIWFGSDEKVANRKSHGITTANELKNDIEKQLPSELKGLIDVFVLDVSRS